MIIFDLDGTLADCEHRRHFVDLDKMYPGSLGLQYQDGRKWKPDWKSFYEACDKDSPIEPTIEIIRSWGGYDTLRKYEEIMIWSGRCESVKDKTKKWLSKYGIVYHSLKMRPIGDSTPDDELKERWLDESLAEGKTIDFVFDDSELCCNMWRRRGIFTLYVNQI